MTEHTNDIQEVEYPEDTDEGEVFDLVVRKGPISFDALMDQIWTYSRDETFEYLTALKRKGYVERREGDLEEDGTSRDLWYVPDND